MKVSEIIERLQILHKADPLADIHFNVLSSRRDENGIPVEIASLKIINMINDCGTICVDFKRIK